MNSSECVTSVSKYLLSATMPDFNETEESTNHQLIIATLLSSRNSITSLLLNYRRFSDS